MNAKIKAPMKEYLIRNNQWSAKRKAPMKDYLTAINKTYINHIGANHIC